MTAGYSTPTPSPPSVVSYFWKPSALSWRSRLVKASRGVAERFGSDEGEGEEEAEEEDDEDDGVIGEGLWWLWS